MKKIRGDAACRRAADVTRIARTSSPACRSRCFRDRRRACGPPRTASAARTIRAARRRRHAPGVDARRGIVGAIGAHRHARRGGAPSRVRRAARNASPCRGERGTDCRCKLHRFGERALQRAGACMNSAFKRVPAGGRSTKTFAVARTAPAIWTTWTIPMRCASASPWRNARRMSCPPPAVPDFRVWGPPRIVRYRGSPFRAQREDRDAAALKIRVARAPGRGRRTRRVRRCNAIDARRRLRCAASITPNGKTRSFRFGWTRGARAGRGARGHARHRRRLAACVEAAAIVAIVMSVGIFTIVASAADARDALPDGARNCPA